MLGASDLRAEAVFALWAEGMPVRKIAEVIGVSPSVSQRLLEKARESRPRLPRREERVSYELHRAVAEKILDPEPVLGKARTNLLRMSARTRGAYGQGWVAEWDELINGGDINRLVENMLRPDERGIDLRQMTPFAGVLSQVATRRNPQGCACGVANSEPYNTLSAPLESALTHPFGKPLRVQQARHTGRLGIPRPRSEA